MGTIPTFPTLVDGQIVTATDFAAIKAVSDFWALTPRCYAYQNTGQSLSNSTSTAITLDAEVYDVVQSGDSPSHDTATNNTRLVCRTTGKYEITGQVQFASNATGTRQAQIRLNAAGSGAGGTLLAAATQSPLTGISTSVSVLPIEAQLAAGDYIEIFGVQSSGAALNTTAGFLGLTFLRMKLTGS